jgi:hypothetical protein
LVPRIAVRSALPSCDEDAHDRVMTTLDVLLLESRSGASALAARDLEAAGHRVHRCHEPGEPAFPCAALTGACPVDDGVDVALLVRPTVAPRPAVTEEGVTCAIRAGLPIVEQGSDILDPFATWVTHRVGPNEDVVAACKAAIDISDGPLRENIGDRIAGLLDEAGVDGDDVSTRVVRTPGVMEVHLDLPVPAEPRRDHALTVRALDAVRATGARRPAQTRVYVHPSDS